jgi:hypothetical protein
MHGSLQSALNAAILQLGAAKDPTPEIIESIRGDIAGALARVGFDSSRNYSFDQAQWEVSKIWAGTIEIKWNLAPQALEALKKNPATSECLAEVLREAVSNASKHGKATMVEIKLSSSRSKVSIEAVDNGHFIHTGKTHVLGSKLLDDVCKSWTLDPEPSGGTKLSAELTLEG